MSESEEELSGVELLAKLLADTQLSDVSLEGSDGVHVPANRCILATKSSVFKTMLYGNFREASSPIVKTEYDGIILKAVVQYVYTDAAKILDGTEENQMKQVANLVKLYGAATYYNLPGLCKKTQGKLVDMVNTQPLLCFAILEAGNVTGPSFPKEIKDVAMGKIKKNKIDNVSAEAVALLSPPVLEAILKEKEHQMPELELFNLLKMWADWDGAGMEGNRHEIAVELSKNLCLELIDPVHLSDVVSSSGMVTEKQLLEAYKKHALAASEANGKPTKKARHMGLQWKDSLSDVVCGVGTDHDIQLLDYPAIRSGVHQWQIKVERLCGYSTWLGIAHTGIQMNLEDFLGRQSRGWGFSDHGHALHNNQNHGGSPHFSVGSMVTLTLDLLPDEVDGGSLSAKVDNGSPYTVFKNLRASRGTDGGFVPAASLHAPGRVRILDIEKLRD